MERMKQLSAPWFFFLMGLMAACQEGPGKSPFKAVDANGDGKIEEAELQAEHQRKDYHKTWDENWDGRLDRAEWNSGLKQYFQGFRYRQALYERWQLDQDTSSVSPRELAHGLFLLYDANGDGKLSPAEYKAHRGTEG